MGDLPPLRPNINAEQDYEKNEAVGQLVRTSGEWLYRSMDNECDCKRQQDQQKEARSPKGSFAPLNLGPV